MGDAVDARTDLWALGATLYEMLAGRPAVRAVSLAKLYPAILQEPAEPLDGLCPGLPPELTRLVERLLAKAPADRPESATEVAQVLAPLTNPEASVVAAAPRPASSSAPAPPWLPGWRVMVASVALAALALGGFTAHSMGLLQPSGSGQRNPTIAVLPFVNLGGDTRADRLASGLTEDLITDLSRFRNLDVIAHESIRGYGDGATDRRRIARELGVRYALEGSLQQEGDQIRVTAQLLEVDSGAHLWGERWDRPAADVFAIQSEVAEAVAGQIGGDNGAIVTVDRERTARKRPQDLDAYDQYLLGAADLGAASRASIERAIGHFERSIALDPTLARAWTGLARSNLQLRDHIEDGRTPLLRAVEAARPAVALDPRDGEAAAALGFALGEQGSLAEAEAMFERALALNPSSTEILTSYASWASTFGKPEVGVAAAQRALQLNPNMPPSALGKYRYAFFMSGSYDEALRIHARIPPGSAGRDEFVYRAVLLNETGRGRDAREAVVAALERFPTLSIEGWSGQAGYNDAERERWVATMRKAGFPVCASEAALVEQAVMRRLPECAAGPAS
jgi:TolB-like protein/cytochrome c-type biogenesis protein CcmH/NrfG